MYEYATNTYAIGYTILDIIYMYIHICDIHNYSWVSGRAHISFHTWRWFVLRL